MSMIFVSDLLDSPGKIELEATAVIPDPAADTRCASRGNGSPPSPDEATY